jgi:hypothetical protein
MSHVRAKFNLKGVNLAKQCLICREKFRKSRSKVSTLICGHKLHLKCLRTILGGADVRIKEINTTKCPVCFTLHQNGKTIDCEEDCEADCEADVQMITNGDDIVTTKRKNSKKRKCENSKNSKYSKLVKILKDVETQSRQLKTLTNLITTNKKRALDKLVIPQNPQPKRLKMYACSDSDDESVEEAYKPSTPAYMPSYIPPSTPSVTPSTPLVTPSSTIDQEYQTRCVKCFQPFMFDQFRMRYDCTKGENCCHQFHWPCFRSLIKNGIDCPVCNKQLL